jgi:mono/diheme cytochrome c family protein
MSIKSRQPGHGTTGLLLCALCVSAVNLPGCRGEREDKPPHQFFPDLDDAPKWKPQTQTEFYADGRSMRPEVEGTVAFSRWGYTSPDMLSPDHGDAAVQERIMGRAELLKEDEAVYQGTDASGRYVRTIPIPVTQELINRGQERFNIYCSACHGYNGGGNGMVGQRWTGLTVANFHDPKYTDPNEPDQKSADGFIFYTAMHGVPNPADPKSPKMPPYRHALTERDAWAIVSYIRVLQQSVPLDQVPDPAIRQKLEAERAKLPPETAPAATGPAGGTGQAGGTGTTGAPARPATPATGAPGSTAPTSAPKGQP